MRSFKNKEIMNYEWQQMDNTISMNVDSHWKMGVGWEG
jgi:hypothetical protein